MQNALIKSDLGFNESLFWLTEQSDAHVSPNRIMPWQFTMDMDFPVIDFGCGNGRWCHLFKPDLYIGYDINPHRIKANRAVYPYYLFTNDYGMLPKGRMLFMFAVALHISEDQLIKINDDLKLSRVMICESLDYPKNKGWSGDVNEMAAYRRTDKDYERIFGYDAQLKSTVKIEGRDYKIHILDLY